MPVTSATAALLIAAIIVTRPSKVLGLIASSFWIVRPFVLSTIWATTIVVATWPMMLNVEAKLGRRRGAAVAVMVLVMLLAFVLPVGMAIGSIVSHRATIAGWIAGIPGMTLPVSPEFSGKREGTLDWHRCSFFQKLFFLRRCRKFWRGCAWLWELRGWWWWRLK